MTNEVELKGKSLTANPFGSGNAVAQSSGGNAMMTAEMQRQIAETQAQFMMARYNPRNRALIWDKVQSECSRSSLAENALFAFAKGGSEVSGLSIRALEMIARCMGNIKFGFRCLDRKAGTSMMQAYALDLENNTSVERTFEVRHVRSAKKTVYPITDEREIYELEANQAQRRVRSCITALVDVDILDLAEETVKATLSANVDTSPAGVQKILEAFKKFNVNKAMIEAKIQRDLNSITASQMVDLRSVYNSLKDSMSTVETWFDVSLADSPAQKNGSNDANASSLSDLAKKSAEEQKAKTVVEDKPEPRIDYKPIVGNITVLINEARTIDDIDAAWNSHAEVLTELSEVDKTNFDMLDKLYIKNREALEKSQSQPKTLV